MSDLRPSGVEFDGAAQLLASARARLLAATADLGLPDGQRLSDRQRHVVRSIAARLARAIEDELRSALAEALPGDEIRAALTSSQVEIALPILEASGALISPGFVEILLRRAEEHRLHRPGASENALLIDLAGDADEAIAGEAMGLLIARSSRFDSFGDPVLARSDLPAELEHRLVWTVAAALRRYAVERHDADPPLVDESLSAAAARLLAGYDEGDGFEARSLRLARLLRDSGRLDDAVTVRALSDAGLPLLVAILSVRTGLDAPAVWQIHLAGSPRGSTLLLRGAGIARDHAGAIFLALGAEEAQLVSQLAVYDSASEAEARRLLTLWATDPGYRAAVARLT
jgi:plasmid stability protein